MLSIKLKENTKTNHQLLEKSLIGRMRTIQSTQNYISLLQLFYTYFGGLEQKINAHLNNQSLPDYLLRRKADSLAADITALGGQPGSVADDNALPGINNHLQALGALYVIEGSTLGGKIISAMISKQLNISNGSGLSFFNSYGDNTEAMWETFKNALDQQTVNAAEEEVVIASADQTFVKFKEWAEKHG